MRFVIADDVKSWRDRNRAFLEHGGHEVLAEAPDGKIAVQLCRDLRPDAVLLDKNMPNMDGSQAARVIIEERLAQYVFMCSSETQKAVSDELKALGAHYIGKPYHRPELLQEIARVTGA